MIRFILALWLFWLLPGEALYVQAQQYSQHRIALEVTPVDSLAVDNQSNQLLDWQQASSCAYQALPLRSLCLHHLRDGRMKGYAAVQDSLPLPLDSLRKRLLVNRSITVYDVESLMPKDSLLRISAQASDIQGFKVQLYWFFDSTRQAACTEVRAFAPILPQQPPTWIKLSDSISKSANSTEQKWTRQTRLDLRLNTLPQEGAGLQPILQQLLQGLRREELRAYGGPYACDTSFAEQIELWLQGGPLLYTLRNPDTQEEFVDTIQILPLEAHRIRRLACLLRWQFDRQKQLLRVELKALGPIKRKPSAGKAKAQPLFWWHF